VRTAGAHCGGALRGARPRCARFADRASRHGGAGIDNSVEPFPNVRARRTSRTLSMPRMFAALRRVQANLDSLCRRGNRLSGAIGRQGQSAVRDCSLRPTAIENNHWSESLSGAPPSLPALGNPAPDAMRPK
jgi:hypothetical protein